MAASQGTTARARATVEYREIPGYPGYRIGTDGTVWSRRACGGRRGGGWLRKEWKQIAGYIGPTGYHQVTLRVGGRTVPRKVHRLILIAFVGPCPDGMEGCHNNGNCLDNRLENLRWDTRQGNVDDTKRHGTRRLGSRVAGAKLSADQVRAIRRDYRRLSRECSQRALAKKYGVTQSHLSRILSGKIWGWLDDQPERDPTGA